MAESQEEEPGQKPDWNSVKWYKPPEEERPDTLKGRIFSSVGIILLMALLFGTVALVYPYFVAMNSRDRHSTSAQGAENVAARDTKSWAMMRATLGGLFGAGWGGIFVYRALRDEKKK